VHRLDAPLAAGYSREVCRAGALRAEAGDGVHDFLADQRAAGVVAVAADPRDLPDVREIDAVPGTCGPEGAADDPAVTAVQFRVIGVAGPVPLDGVEDRALEFRLVALDEQEVRRAAASVFFRPGDVVRGVSFAR
jgi:hypothetical protein